MFPSECMLERRVRSDGDKDLADDSNLPLFILKCEDRKADGYADHELELYNQRLENMVIGVRLADAPPAVSYLAILGARLQFARIIAFDKTVIIIRLGFAGEGTSYLIYDAVALSLRMIPPPEDRDPSWMYILGSRVSLARACEGNVYALVHTGMLGGVDEVASLYLWRPSSPSPPWSEKRKPTCRDLIVHYHDSDFSFNGHAYWVDLLCGVSYYRCDALFNDNTSVAKFRGYIPLPVEDGSDLRSNTRLAGRTAYRTMGAVRGSFIRFVSIDGFQSYVKLKNRTVTVWKLLGHDQDEPWEEEHKFSLKMLWGFEGFGDLPKNLTPMNPLLSTKDADVIYLMLGEYREDQFNFRFFPYNPRYLLAINMRNKTVTSVPLATDWSDDLVPCRFGRKLRKALVGPCNDQGIPMIPMMKKEHAGRHDDGGDVVVEDLNPMKKKKNKRRRKEA